MKMVKGIKVCWKLVLPAFIVSVLNVTLFLNLRYYETAPYFMLSSSRVLLTGALHQWFVGRSLGANKWTALAFLTLSDLFVHVPSLLQLDDLSFHFVLLVLVHSFASSFAQVFLEFRLKSDPEISAPVKSTYFSIFSALFSLLWILLSKPVLLKNERNFLSGYSTSVYLAAFLFALTSAHTTFFLKCLSVFWLQFVQSVSFLLVALASYFLFDDVLSIDFLLAVGSFAVALYFLRSDVLSSFSSSSSPSQSFPHSILSEFSPKSHSDPSSKSLV